MIDRQLIGHTFPEVAATLERGRLRFFAKAIGETGGVYVDVDAARRAGYPDLLAPPTFLFGLEIEGGRIESLAALLQVPLAKILHAEQGFVYHRPVCAGDTVTLRSSISDIYAKKAGALEFVVKDTEARNQHGDLVAGLRTVIVVRH